MPNNRILHPIHIPHQARHKVNTQLARQLRQTVHIEDEGLGDAVGGEFALGQQFLEGGDEGGGRAVAGPVGDEQGFAGAGLEEGVEVWGGFSACGEEMVMGADGWRCWC